MSLVEEEGIHQSILVQRDWVFQPIDIRQLCMALIAALVVLVEILDSFLCNLILLKLYIV